MQLCDSVERSFTSLLVPTFHDQELMLAQGHNWMNSQSCDIIEDRTQEVLRRGKEVYQTSLTESAKLDSSLQ